MTTPAAARLGITVSSRVAADHDDVRDLVTTGFGGRVPADVEIHVRARSPRTSWAVLCAGACPQPTNYRAGRHRGHQDRHRDTALQLAGDTPHLHPQRLVTPSHGFSGRTYPRLPAAARVAPGIRFLVTLTIPIDPAPAATGVVYPRAARYRRYATAPNVVLSDWREELLHLTAHEARHVDQIRHQRPRSEIDAERAAHARLAAWRHAQGLPVLAPAAYPTEPPPVWAVPR